MTCFRTTIKERRNEKLQINFFKKKINKIETRNVTSQRKQHLLLKKSICVENPDESLGTLTTEEEGNPSHSPRDERTLPQIYRR